MSKLPLISVIVPVYNVERYIEETLCSIQAQDYRNFEVVIVDDCSSDRTFDICRQFSFRDSRFKVLRNQQNSQIAASLNCALKHVSGDFIARCDGDDVMAPDRLSQQYNFLLKNPKIGLVGCSFETIDESGTYLRRFIHPSGPELLKKLLTYCTPVPHIWLAKRELYDDVGEYRMQTVEDYDFLLRASKKGWLFDNIETYFGMKIRIRSGNTVSSYGIAQRKLFNYARNVSTNKIDYSEETVKLIIENRSVGFLAKLHRFSDVVSLRASLQRSFYLKILLHLTASLISPLKAQYYYFAVMRILMIKVWKLKQ